jgi:hypothetical protein
MSSRIRSSCGRRAGAGRKESRLFREREDHLGSHLVLWYPNTSLAQTKHRWSQYDRRNAQVTISRTGNTRILRMSRRAGLRKVMRREPDYSVITKITTPDGAVVADRSTPLPCAMLPHAEVSAVAIFFPLIRVLSANAG